MIRSLYPDLAQNVQNAIAREGRFMLPDIALIEHVIDLVDTQLEACVVAESKRIDAQRDAELLPHDETPIGPSAVVPAAVVPTAPAPAIDAPIAATDETAHASPAG